MKRIAEKVKDLVEVRSHRNLSAFADSPGEVLLTYHFTEFTAAVMSDWLEDLARTSLGRGRVRVLTGQRGVGKSHFIGAFSAIVSQTEIRSRIPEASVALSAQSLRRRKYPVARVRRGAGETLFGELRSAVAAVLGTDPELLGNTVDDVLRSAAGRPTELPFVLVIDSEVERSYRTRKADGQTVSEIIRAAKHLNVFVALALDGDLVVTGGFGDDADSVRVDFLDSDTFNQVVEAVVFPKSRGSLRILHEVYDKFRSQIPSFRWSEQRFSSIYPLHPAVVDLAPAVRAYAPGFGVLRFAAEAGTRIVGRPADSLIAIDEVFDFAEADLRESPALADAFATFDRLSAEVVTTLPVMERLQAKLVLKALVLLSLEGAGASASDVSSALMIYDERDPDSGSRLVKGILETFAGYAGSDILRTEAEGREARFRLRLGAKEDFNRRVVELAAAMPDSEIASTLRQVAEGRFEDLLDTENVTHLSPNWSVGEMTWRGSLRRGKIVWTSDYSDFSLRPRTLTERAWDWGVIMRDPDDATPVPDDDGSGSPVALWQHGRLSDEDRRVLKMYRVLACDDGLSAEFGDQFTAALHSAAREAEAVWLRTFVTDGVLILPTGHFKLETDAADARHFSEIMSVVLGPVFDVLYPEHPFFERTLGLAELSVVAGNLFGGSRQSLPEVQMLASVFAEPLGLVSRRGELLGLESEARLSSLPVVREVMGLVNASADGPVSLRDICDRLSRRPLGLVRESHLLILAALVAARKIEFVTVHGNRIGRRALDLGISWETIVGISHPEIVALPAENLARWVQLLTGDRSIVSLDGPDNEEAARKAIEIWLADWRSARLLDRFSELPDDIITDKTWNLFANVERTYGVAAKTVEMISEGSMALAEGVNRVADAFADDEEAIGTRGREISDLEEFMVAAALREKIWKYLAICEPTGNEEVEWCRKLLGRALDQGAKKPSHETNNQIKELWNTFHQLFSEHFVDGHDSVMKARSLKVRVDAIVSGDEWWEFEALSRIPIFSQGYWERAARLRKSARHLDCRFPVRSMLEEQPFCGCAYRESTRQEMMSLPDRLQVLVDEARRDFREVLVLLREPIRETVEALARNSWDDDFKAAAVSLLASLGAEGEIPNLSNNEISVLRKAIENLPTIPRVNVNPPRTDFVSRRELRAHLSDWVERLPDRPVLVRV